jgi:hypothetical protein
MSTLSEIQSLDEIQYKSRFKLVLLALLVVFIFLFSFTQFYPVGDKIKSILKASFQGRVCNPDFDEIRMEWLFPKIIISDLVIPSSCLDRQGPPLKFTHLTINYQLINFAPFGLPFKIETELGGQPLSLYYVAGLGQQFVRLKDQSINLIRIQPLLGDNFKLAGTVLVDMSMGLSKGLINSLSLKAQSKDLQIPPQNIQGFTTPSLKINDFYLEAESESPPRIQIQKLVLGNTDSPIRANFKGRLTMVEGNFSMSPADLVGEIAFSDQLKKSIPIIDMMFQSFNQKDGFYQVKLGGTMGSLKPINL